MADLSHAEWRKSTYSENNGCIEVAFVKDGRIAIRDSKDRSGAVLVFHSYEWTAFLRGVRAGQFDVVESPRQFDVVESPRPC